MVEHTLKDCEGLYASSYGDRYKISRSKLIYTAIFILLITPFTNWLIPSVPFLIKRDLTIRYEKCTK